MCSPQLISPGANLMKWQKADQRGRDVPSEQGPAHGRARLFLAPAGAQAVYLGTTTVRFAFVKTVNSVPAGITAESPFFVAPIPNVRMPRAAA